MKSRGWADNNIQPLTRFKDLDKPVPWEVLQDYNERRELLPETTPPSAAKLKLKWQSLHSSMVRYKEIIRNLFRAHKWALLEI